MPRELYKYCKKCGSECLEYESGRVKCPLCQKILKSNQYIAKTKQRPPKSKPSKPPPTNIQHLPKSKPINKQRLFCPNCDRETVHEIIQETFKCKRCGLAALTTHVARQPLKDMYKFLHWKKCRKKTRLKILLHAPLHPSYWVYLLETLPEHKWYIEPNDNFEEGGTPKDHIKYTVVPRNTRIKFDVQIFCLNSHHQLFPSLMKRFGHIPIVFLDFYGAWGYMPSSRKKYPLISCCHHASMRHYSNNYYAYVPPSRTLWNQDWEGDIRKVFIPAQRYLEPEWKHTFAAKLVPRLMKTDLKPNLNIVLNRLRTIPWKEWQSHFIHNRVLLDIADKHSSFVLEEAMTIGMPIISRNIFETPWVVRDKVDGFTIWTEKELIELLHKFIEDDSFANKWSLNSRNRGKEILSAKRTNAIWNRAFQDAIRLSKRR